MYAIFENGGKQYKAAKGDVIDVRFAKSRHVNKPIKGFAPIVKVE